MYITGIEIQTDKLEETEKFYKELLGFSIKKKDQHSVSFSAGRSILTFIRSTGIQPTYHFAFNIPKNKLAEAVVWLSAKLDLIKIDNDNVVADFESWNAKAIYFFDNNGNILEFIVRYDLDNNSEKPFDSSSVECISEIGIVADSLKVLKEKLMNENNISFFKQDTGNESFAAIGDNHGLFILVTTNRKWYPTEQKAKKQYTKIHLLTDGLKKEIVLNENSEH